MELNTKIIVKPRYSSEYECDICLKKIDNMLYNVIVGQEIILEYEYKMLHTRVLEVLDIVCDDAIYRNIEVVVIDKNL